MPTIERSTELLSGAKGVDGLTGVARELGFIGVPLSLDIEARSVLGLPPSIDSAKVVRGAGALRALILDFPRRSDIRETLAAVAVALSRRTPQLVWIVLASAGDQIAVVCWSASGSRPRVVSLVCNREKLFVSDAETLCALSAATGESELLIYARWLDILGRESITRKFFRALEVTVGTMSDSLEPGVPPAERRELALVYLSRLIFLSFLETKGWLDGDFGFLENGYSRCMTEGGRYQRRVLEPLFFGTLNTRVGSRAQQAQRFGRIPFLNGGLFARSSLEKRARRLAFSDEAFGDAYGSLLSRHRFSGREDSTDWSDASIDPEILGKAFEALMATSDRKGSGAFYTPQDLVEHVTDEALTNALPGDASLSSLVQLRVMDPACGSGAFLVYILERLAKMRIERGETGSIAEVRRRVLASSIFGVDLNPTAVWLCELRLWLSVVVESAEADPMRVVPLPNLDRHIRVGDSLAGGGLGHGCSSISGRKLETLRARYMRASGPRKRTLALALDRQERTAAIGALSRSLVRFRAQRKELLLDLRARDLFGNRHVPAMAERARLVDLRNQVRSVTHRARVLRSGGALPFSFETHFADAAAADGFDIVVGNPPWVRLHRIGVSSRDALRREFAVYRDAAWRRGATLAGAGRGFAAQVDMAALFVERSHDLLKTAGVMALLLPAKLWRSLAGGGVRQLLAERSELLLLEDRADAKSDFDASVYPSLLVGRNKPFASNALDDARAAPEMMRCEVHSRERVLRWKSPTASLPLDDTPGSPWLLMPNRARRAFDRIADAGPPLADSLFGRPLLGVKTGCNEAFLVHVDSVDGDLATIRANGRRERIEKTLLRPAVRGEYLSPGNDEEREHVIWPHNADGQPLPALPPLARRWLLPYRRQLSERSDLHNRNKWWSIFRVESACSDKPRVIWADIGRRPRAMVAESGDRLVPLNTCYAVQCPTLDDARALAALLNGPLAAAWLDVIAEPARGAYRRYLGWTMALLPIPRAWTATRERLAALSSCARAPSDADLLLAAVRAYGLTLRDVEPLLEWTGRSS
ncbi:MAG: N-6 DNA methylase [Gemmatimonadaceae bacterium]